MQALDTDILSMNSELSSQPCYCLGVCLPPAESAGECLVTGRSALKNLEGLLLYSIVFRC